jgi:hypothetical protein
MNDALKLELLTDRDFSPHSGSPFGLRLTDSAALMLTLREVTPFGRDAPPQRRPFSLLFAGPKAPALPQKIYALQHEALGTFEIFLVPIRETAEERHYEAIFG